MPKLGEVIAANTASFVGQCYALHQPPELGSLVRASDGKVDVYGIVSSAETHSIEEGRRPIARGAVESDEDVFSTHPQLASLLCTDFTAIVVGHRSDNGLCRYLPPRPARIHSFVHACESAESKEFSASPGFLRMLVSDQTPWIDEVISACLRRFSTAQDEPEAYLVSAGKELAVLLGGDFTRLGNIMKRMKGQ
ncbi:MAG: hypothetical protein HYY32_05935 [Chloroflexi bacterium]|nr:hypothetical protein [Chloroflexota bacterium]